MIFRPGPGIRRLALLGLPLIFAILANAAIAQQHFYSPEAGMNAFGGGLFFTSNNFGGTLSITDTTMTGNTGGHWTQIPNGTANAGTAVGTNCKSVTISTSMIQGLNGVP